MEVKELFQHALAIKKYCHSMDSCELCPLDVTVCSDDDTIIPEDWSIPKEYLEEEEEK